MKERLRALAGPLLAGVALWSLGSAAARREIAPFEFVSREGCAERFERRFAPFRRHLPAVGIVGYVGQPEPAGRCNAYYLAQYALAPIVVSPQVDSGIRQAVSRAGEVVAEELPLVLVDERRGFETWLRDHPEYRALARHGGVVLAARRHPW